MDPRQNLDPLLIRLHAWQSKAWQKFLKSINAFVAAIIRKGMQDETIVPVRRYLENRKVLTQYLSKYNESKEVKKYNDLTFERSLIWQDCLEASRKAAYASFVKSGVCRSPTAYKKKQGFYQFLEPFYIGNVSLDGKVVHRGVSKANESLNLKWACKNS